MNLSDRLRQIYDEARNNRWFHYFAVFCRITLAIGFIISGLVKVSGERFASGLPVNNPMGQYLEALHHTEYYYTFIGIAQIIIALLLLIPRTSLLGAIMYFPIILNICILAYAVRFEGTRVISENMRMEKPSKGKFPFWFFGSVVVILAAVVYLNMIVYNIRPGNSAEECFNGCPYNGNPQACETFCDCLYNQGRLLRDCLREYNASNSER